MKESKLHWPNRHTITASLLVAGITIAGSKALGQDIVSCGDSRNVPSELVCPVVDSGRFAKDAVMGQLSKALSDMTMSTE